MRQEQDERDFDRGILSDFPEEEIEGPLDLNELGIDPIFEDETD
jgi:hypothetical protein